MSGDAVLTARLSAMQFAEELEGQARALGLDAHTTGWDDDRLSISARDFSLLLGVYAEARAVGR